MNTRFGRSEGGEREWTLNSTEEHKKLKQEVRDFLERELAPMADERDRQGPLTRQELVGLIKKLMPLGYYTGMLPEEYGGKGY